MPKILRLRGYRFYFYSHEPNEPAHIRVDSEDESAKFRLSPVALARNIGYVEIGSHPSTEFYRGVA